MSTNQNNTDSSSDDERIDTSSSGCLEFFTKNGRDRRYLFAMLVGMPSADGSRSLGDTEVYPYKDAKFRKLFVPTTKHLRAEVSRRAVVEGIPTPKCKHWNRDKLISWLKGNPVLDIVDVEWLLRQEETIYNLMDKNEKEKQEETQAKDWGEIDCWLRLYCCFYDDSIRSLLLTKDQVMDRQELDARNHEVRPPTLWQAVADLFNDEGKAFELPPMPDLHHVFSETKMLRFSDMPGPITADEAKKRMAEARARLMKVISKWELSGNGFGQREATDEEFGHAGEEQLIDGDNRARFLDGVGREHLLVLWDIGDELGLLSNVLNQLSSDVAVDCENIHTDTSNVQNPRRLTEDQKDAKRFRDSLANSMETMSYASLYQQLRESEDKIIKLQEQTWQATTEGALDFYEACLAKEKERRDELVEELSRVKKQRTG